MPAPVATTAGDTLANVAGGTCNLPTASIGDLRCAVCETSGGEAVTVPSGWTQLGMATTDPITSNSTRQTLLGRIKESGDPDTITIADPGDHLNVATFKVTGMPTASYIDVIDDTTFSDTATTAVSWPSVNTSVADALIIAIVTTGHGTVETMSGETNANLTGLAELIDFSSTVGNGGGIHVVTGVKATAGAIGTTTATLSLGRKQAKIVLAIKPSSGTTESVSPGGATAGGTTATARATTTTGSSAAAGQPATAAAPGSPGAAVGQGTAPGAAAPITPGAGTAGGVGPSDGPVTDMAPAGGSVAAGTGPAAAAQATAGGATGASSSPTPAVTSDPGGATATGSALAAAALTALGGAAALGLAPGTRVALLPAGALGAGTGPQVVVLAGRGGAVAGAPTISVAEPLPTIILPTHLIIDPVLSALIVDDVTTALTIDQHSTGLDIDDA